MECSGFNGTSDKSIGQKKESLTWASLSKFSYPMRSEERRVGKEC